MLYEQMKQDRERKLLRTEYIARAYPLSKQATEDFNGRYGGKQQIDMLYEDYVEDRMLSVEDLYGVFRNKSAFLNNLKFGEDFDIEITDIIHHEYDPGLVWDDIKKL